MAATLTFLTAGTIGALGATDRVALKPSSGTCLMDSGIPAETRVVVESSAETFVHAILDMKPYIASQIMAQDARNQAVATEGIRALVNYLHETGPYNNLKLAHTYLPKMQGGGPDAMIRCTPGAGTDWVAIKTTPGATQAYVLLTAKTVNNDWAFVVWLERESDTWRVRDIEVTPASIVGHTPDDLLKLARDQRDHGNIFNAQMLYIAAQFTSNRGKTYELEVIDKLKEDLQTFKGAPEFQGDPPFGWKMNGLAFTISHVTALGVDGKLGLTFDLPLEQWKDNKDADTRNRVFLDAFRIAHPEYAQAFDFLVARAMKPDNSGGFSTVYDNNGGYAN